MVLYVIITDKVFNVLDLGDPSKIWNLCNVCIITEAVVNLILIFYFTPVPIEPAQIIIVTVSWNPAKDVKR